MRKRYLILFAISFLIVALDQITKMYVHMNYQLGESTPILPGLFNLTYVRNFGAAFGFLAETHPAFREIFFLAMPPVALLIILLILRGVEDNDYWQVAALSSVFGGAIGNYIDRLRFRYVIDFLDFHWKERYTWPAFNVADMAIVGGVIALLILMFIEGRKERAATHTSSAEPGS
ncbi:MAG: signal peptidase II [Bdellovibrio sp.]|jgi:signal peptidase II